MNIFQRLLNIISESYVKLATKLGFMADRQRIENGRIVEYAKNQIDLGEIEWTNNDSLLFTFGTKEEPLRDKNGNIFNFSQLALRMVCEMKESYTGPAIITFDTEDGSLVPGAGTLKFAQPLASAAVNSRNTLYGDVELTTQSGRKITLYNFSIFFRRDYTSPEGIKVPSSLEPLRTFDVIHLHSLSAANLSEGQDITPPTARITPRNNTVDISVTGPYSIVFNEPVRHAVDGKTVEEEIKLIEDKTNTEVEIIASQRDAVTWFIEPKMALQPNVGYRIVIGSNLTDLAKNRLESTSSYFTTATVDVTAPVPNVNLTQNSQVGSNFEFDVQYTEDVNQASGGLLTQNNILGTVDIINQSNGNSLPLTLTSFTKPEGRISFKFKTTNQLAVGENYRLVINNVADKAGNVVTNFTIDFSVKAAVTQTAPTFAKFIPANPVIPQNAPVDTEVATIETNGNPIGVISLPSPTPGAPNDNQYFKVSGNKILIKQVIPGTQNRVIAVRSTNNVTYVYNATAASIQPSQAASPPANVRLSDGDFAHADLPWQTTILYDGNAATSIQLLNHTDKFEILPGTATLRTKAGYTFPDAVTIYSVTITVTNADGQATRAVSISKSANNAPPTSPGFPGITAKTNALNRTEADHLKRRMGMGLASMGDNRFEGQTPQQAVAAMLQPEPIKQPYAPIHTSQGNNNVNVGKDRGPITRWFLGTLFESQLAGPRLAYFFHVVLPSADGASRLNSQQYWQWRMFLETANDPDATLKELLFNFSIDNLESRMLNNNQNGDLDANGNPTVNQNYGREFLELYTIGKREPLPYNEDDVDAASECLSGWRESYTEDYSKGAYGTFKTNAPDPDLHIWKVKQFSSLFGNATIGGPRPSLNGGTEQDDKDAMVAELDALVDMAFHQSFRPEFGGIETAAIYWTVRLFRFYGYRDTEGDTMQSFIIPLAQILVDNDYKIHTWLTAFFTSELFYDQDRLGNIHKSPLEVVAHGLRIMNVPIPKLQNNDGVTWDKFMRSVESRMNFMGYRATESTRFAAPDDAFGYRPYYQAPFYDREWSNADDTADTQFFVAEFLQTGHGGVVANLFQMYLNDAPRDPADPTKPTQDPDTFVRFFMSRLYEDYAEISEDRRIDFVGDKERLLPNEDGGGSLLQGDVYSTWASEYRFQYEDDNDPSALESRLKRLFREFHRVLETFYF